jgi:hypothetical protein
VLAVHGQNSSGRFLVYELVIPSRITTYPMEGECWQSADRNPPDDYNFRIPYSEGSLPPKHNFLKFRHENDIKMKNKPGSLTTFNLSNEIKKGTKIPLKHFFTITISGKFSFFTYRHKFPKSNFAL